MNARSLFLAATYNELCSEFSNTFGWPFRVPFPENAAENAIQNVIKTYADSKNFLEDNDEPVQTGSFYGIKKY